VDDVMVDMLAAGWEPDPNSQLGAMLLTWLADIEDQCS
jgi:hypothetical protein